MITKDTNNPTTLEEAGVDISEWDLGNALQYVSAAKGSKKYKYCVDNVLPTMFSDTCFTATKNDHPNLFNGSLDE